MSKVWSAAVAAVRREPAVLFAVVALAVAVAARFGLHLDATQLLTVIAAVFGVSTVATRSVVWSPAGHEAAVAEAEGVRP